ncbi:acyl-CoA dehydrogenase family protein [Nonomuraea cavernae]|uniref:Acyl-CoA dehydrogenase C-terminal domain-containing protein n=1 Tax=Nonomuraea cavernae TaxID=2045107 RepID=A0A917ZGR1_9ACTN|nr:acyl-CoA dehydrogenase family protein [Nonomuraea cavernae]MCA2189507.1 hypothetical protein [Nonomuraea cavernae]GGO81774.1 hypothetical protein GCM10012289_71520 [Nonomuraea cavernae]
MLGNWDVLGLRATGSIDYSIDGAFVPESQTHVFAQNEPLRGGAIYRLGVLDQALICHSAWALGVGRRLLDELIRYAEARAGRPGQIAGSDAFHADFARAEATFRAAKALVHATWDDTEHTLDSGRTLDVRQETMVRLALNHVTSGRPGSGRILDALRPGAVSRTVQGSPGKGCEYSGREGEEPS